MDAEPDVRVAESLERGDLFALDGDGSPQNHVEQERGHGEEDQGHEEPHGLELGQLVLEVPVRGLIRARNRAQAAVRIENRVEFDDRSPLEAGRTVGQRQGDVVEPALHLERGGQVPAGHPQEAEVLRIRDQFSRSDAVDVLRTERDTDDLQWLPAAVDDREQTIAQVEAVSLGEALADQCFLRPVRVQEAPAAQGDIVERRPAAIRQGDQASVDRIGDVRHVQRDAHDHPGLDLLDSRDRRDPLFDPIGNALGAGEHVGEGVAGVVRVPGGQKRPEDSLRHDQQRDSRRDDQGDRQHLGTHVPKVAQQFTVEGSHRPTTRSWPPAAWSSCERRS